MLTTLCRAHFRVFGAMMLPEPTLGIASLAPYVQHVYGTDFYSSMALGAASVVFTGPLDTWNVTAAKVGCGVHRVGTLLMEQQSPPKQVRSLCCGFVFVTAEQGVGAAARKWRRFLCRHKLWPRYCDSDDVRHYMALPQHHQHTGKALTRAELEAMELASKKG